MPVYEGISIMLWYKEWRESRLRFLISACVLAGICGVCVLLEGMLRAQLGARSAPLNTYTGYIYLRIYAGFARGTFLVLSLLLGLGGLQRERARHTDGFTLALPATRFQLVAVRGAMGLFQVFLLACLPALLVPGLSPLVHQAYPWSQALQFGLLWIGIGFAVFATAFLFSAVFSSEYAALTASVLAFYLYPLVARIPALRPYPLHIHYIMNGTGMPYFDPRSDLLTGPLPWTILGVVAAITLGMLMLAVRITQDRDFS